MNLIDLPKKFEDVAFALLFGITKNMSRSLRRTFVSMLKIAISNPYRFTYLQMARLGLRSEKTYRNLAERDFDWQDLNMLAIEGFYRPDEELAVALDPFFIPKSGSKTPGLGYFWSGSASRALKGMENVALAAVGLDSGKPMMLGTFTTVPSDLLAEKDLDLISYYNYVVGKTFSSITKFTDTILADAYFAKKRFVDALRVRGLHLISRFRDDARLRYCEVRQGDGDTRRRGPKPIYGSRIDPANPETGLCERFEIDGVDGYFLTTKAWSLSLGRKLRIVMYYGNDNGGKESRRHTPKIFFCTDPDTTGPRIARFYRLRFQIEFEIRDAKQFTGLGHSQSRSFRSYEFASNLSFTALNIARIVMKDSRLVMFIGQFKRVMVTVGELLKIIPKFGKRPNLRIIGLIDSGIRNLAGLTASEPVVNAS